MKKKSIVVLSIAILCMTGCGDPNANQAIETGKDVASAVMSSGSEAAEAYTCAKQAIKDYLSCPSTATFPMYSSDFVSESEEGAFIVNAYVDAQNLAGAVVRSDFSVYIILGDEGEFQYQILSMN